MVGGSGDDKFQFIGGNDRIKDFDASMELINLRKIDGLENFADIAAASEVDGNDVVMTFSEGDLRLKNVDINDLSIDNFIV
jgi:hypothetical protein